MIEAWKNSYRHAQRPFAPVKLRKREICVFSSLDNDSKVLVASDRDLQQTYAIVSTSATTQTEEQALQTLYIGSTSIHTYHEWNILVDVRPHAAMFAGTRSSSQTEEYQELSPPLRPKEARLMRLRSHQLLTRAPANHPHHRAREHKLSVIAS